MTSAPDRPRLHDDVIVRRHVAEGSDAIVVHDERSRRVLKILPVQWQVLALADGSRDVEGLVLAARARGIEAYPDDVREFLGYLAREGVLTNGVTDPISDDGDPDADLLDVPLDPIEGWRFHCSGRGVCCHVFPSILFTPLEATRAMLAMPDEEHDFLPVRGAPRDGPVVPVLIEGRCRYLEENGHCALHARGGPDAKPLGCRGFPIQRVYDGERIRVSPAFECACIVDGIDAIEGEPPVEPGEELLRDLPRPSKVGRVPARVALDATRQVSRDQVRAFYRALAQAEAPRDVAASLWSLANAVEAQGLEPHVLAAYASPAFDASAVCALLGQLIERFERWQEPLAAFRSANDLTRRALEWIVAASRLSQSKLREPVAPRTEAFYVRTTSWVCRDALGREPLVSALRARALRVWLSRALPEVAGADPRAAEPLALVEVIFRAHGLDAFVE